MMLMLKEVDKTEGEDDFATVLLSYEAMGMKFDMAVTDKESLKPRNESEHVMVDWALRQAVKGNEVFQIIPPTFTCLYNINENSLLWQDLEGDSTLEKRLNRTKPISDGEKNYEG
jgi:hypothetical protein